ncbi:Protein M3 [Microbotryomycetes sp. JL221]|nr:Protein M3 [Microbotryomycetes sp. JL221]
MSESQPSINELIWLSVKPLIKLFIPSTMGFWMSWRGLLPPSGSRAASQIILNITLPSLLFSKILQSFTPDNVKVIGPILLVGIFYMIVPGLFAVLIRVCLPVPNNFRWGLIAAASWSNSGDLPIAVLSSIVGSSPFNGQRDADLAVAYCAIFILLFFVTMFPLRGTIFIERDYTHPIKSFSSSQDQESATVDKTLLIKFATKARDGFRKRRNAKIVEHDAADKQSETPIDKDLAETMSASNNTPSPQIGFAPLRRTSTSRSSQPSIRELAGTAAAASVEEGNRGRRPSKSKHERFRMALQAQDKLRTIVGSPAHSVFDDDGQDVIVEAQTTTPVTQQQQQQQQQQRHQLSKQLTDKDEILAQDDFDQRDQVSKFHDDDTNQQEVNPAWKRVLIVIKDFLASLATPPTISLLTALVCALVAKLKALFLVVPDGSFNPTAPDGKPPLAILLDTATFVGAASVPLGLMVLGSALQRMTLPRPLSKLPYSSIGALAFVKLVLLPIIGFLFVQALTKHTTLVPQDNKVLRFVLIYFSCLPTATTQVALTQIFAPEDGESNSDTLASYILVQYIIFVFSSVVLTAVTLSNIF